MAKTINTDHLGRIKVPHNTTERVTDPSTGMVSFRVVIRHRDEYTAHLSDEEAAELVGAKWQKTPEELKTSPPFYTVYGGRRFFCEHPPQEEATPEVEEPAKHDHAMPRRSPGRPRKNSGAR